MSDAAPSRTLGYGTGRSGLAASGVFLPGEHVGSYEILGVIGEGGMAQVFEARDRMLGRVVAIKAGRAGRVGRSILRKEGQALAAIRHPALVTIHGMGVHRGVEYLVMERIHGITLDAVLRGAHGAPIPLGEALDILTRIAEGLVAIHGAGIAHRDVKPSNVMMAGAQRVVLMDLGIFQPQFADRGEEVTGTPAYMAPETILNRLAPGAWHLVDLYALGVVAFELLAGRTPFDGDLDTILERQLHAPIPDLTATRPDVPTALAALIGDLLAKEPGDRPASAEQVLWRLLAIQKDTRAPRSVLIVDDDDDSRALVAAAVRRVLRGSEVFSAADGRDALDCLRRRTPDLILLDLQMPGMTGVELCMYLRGTGVAPASAIIGVSAHALDADVELLRKLGVRELVRKGPGIADRLGAAIRALYAPAGR